MSTSVNTNYDQNRHAYLAAQDTIETLHEDLAKIERQMIDKFINDAKVFASTLTTYDLAVKNRNLNFIAKEPNK